MCMTTRYIIGSLDQRLYLDRAPKDAGGRYTGVFTHDETLAQRFDSMTVAQLVLFNLETDDACAVALNLIVIPVQEGDGHSTIDVQYMLSLD